VKTNKSHIFILQPISCVWFSLYSRYHVFGFHFTADIMCLVFTLQPISCVWFSLYSRYHVFGFHFTTDIMCLVFTLQPISCVWFSLYSRYHVFDHVYICLLCVMFNFVCFVTIHLGGRHRETQIARSWAR